MNSIELEGLKKLRQFSPNDTGDCGAFCPFLQNGYCRLYEVELVPTTRCAQCNDYSIDKSIILK